MYSNLKYTLTRMINPISNAFAVLLLFSAVSLSTSESLPADLISQIDHTSTPAEDSDISEDDTLFALSSGVVKFVTRNNKKFVEVVPN